MSLFVKLVVLSCAVVCISAAAIPDDLYQGPVFDEDGTSLDEVVEDPGPQLVRERRLTCDLFSFQSQWVSPNHAACAAKCIGMGKRGGTCQNGECVCKKSWWGRK